MYFFLHWSLGESVGRRCMSPLPPPRFRTVKTQVKRVLPSLRAFCRRWICENGAILIIHVLIFSIKNIEEASF